MNQLQPTTTSPFDSIRQFKDGREYWSARDLQTLLGYKNWREFEDSIERAMIACKNVGQNPEDHFGDAPKMIKTGKGASRKVTDYHLTRYACYLTAMNGDPRKPEIAQAQTYFAIKTYEAERQPLQEKLYTLSDAIRERAMLNEESVPTQFFATLIELAKELHYWQKYIDRGLDAEASIEKSVGYHWSRYAHNTLHITDSERITYTHTCPNKRKPVKPYAYPIKYLPAFRRWLQEIYFPLKFPAYQHYRAKRISAQITVKPLDKPRVQTLLTAPRAQQLALTW